MNIARKILATLTLFLFIVNCFSATQIPNTQKKYKFLMLLPFSSPSHRNCFLPLAEELGNRGHQVVLVSSLPPKTKHPNVKEINHGVQIMDDSLNMFNVRETDSTGGFAMFKYFLPKLMKEMYDNPVIRDLYDKRHEFDLMIFDELFSEPAYPFLVGKKCIAIGTAGVLSQSSAVLGNVLNPSYVPAVSVEYKYPYTFFQRLNNIFWHIYLPIYWRYMEVVPKIQEAGLVRFPDMPPLLEIERESLSLVLANTHFSLDASIPLLPSQIEVGGMHCHPGKKLPQDLQNWIDGAGPQGVIYFSLGSVCKGNKMPEKYKKILIEAFGKLKQRVIWKFEDKMEGLPKNVIIRDWLPQQDILAHPNVKLFITHGGLLSMQEAVFHATPLLALPIFGDQTRNGIRIENKGFGTSLIWEDLSVDLVVKTIQELLTNPKYHQTISEVSQAFRDKPATALETAVWWTEYVARHKGAPLLKSHAANISWIEYFNIDIIIFVHFILFCIYFLLKKLYSSLFGRAPSKKKSKRD